MPPERERYLAHYGVPGQKWGHRQWQNADGTYTEAGKHHYGWGYGRRTVGSASGIRPTQRRRTTPGTRSDGIRSQWRPARARSVQVTPTNQYRSSKAEIEAQKARARTIFGIAAGVAVSASAMYGLHRRNKINQNLIQMAKNSVSDLYNDGARNLAGEALRRNREWRSRDIAAITDRYSARRVLGLNTRAKTKQFIKANRLARLNTADLVEYRVGKLVEGYRRTAFGNMKKLLGRRLNRERNRIARRFYV